MAVEVRQEEHAQRAIGEVTIGSRFNGPAISANGGYACGTLARFLPEPAEVTLRTPPPLDRPLQVVGDGSQGVRLMDGAALVAEGRAADPVWADPPVRPSLADAEEARSRHPGIGVTHPLSDCFVCGPRRGDGLHVSPGPLAGYEDVGATPFRPDETFADADGTVPGEVVWAALDCPSYVPSMWLGMQGGISLLGRLTAERLREVRAGEELVVVGWPVAREGRKSHTASAILDRDGELVARAQATWIALQG